MSEPPLPADSPNGRLATVLTRVALHTVLWSVALFVLFRQGGLTVALFRTQDFPILVGGALLLVTLAWRAPALPRWRLPPTWMLVALLAGLVLLLTAAGTWIVFGDFPLTRDEIMADFDAGFLAHGRLLAPIEAEWRPFATALMPQFMLPIPTDSGWLSSYLPGNAALRGLGMATIGAEFVNPLLAAFSVVAIHRIGRRLWPDAPDAALVAALLLASSPQVIAMAMTPYAMTAHLAFNLLWLWCFLRDDRRGDAGAIATGFVATGLHQLLFHPLFVLPFILDLWLRKRRARAILYVVAYAAIGLFWASYWQLVLSGSGAANDQASASGISYLIARVVERLTSIDPGGLITMLFNLLRFVSWQNLVLLPFAALAWGAIRRDDGIARPLAGGIALTTAAMLVLLPWQGHGWGYRYLHGLIPGFCLLAGYGWITVAGERRARGTVLLAGTLASLLVILPLHLKQAHDIVAPYGRAFAMIARSPADVVIVMPAGVLFDDLIRNAADLSNRPKVMTAKLLSEAQVATLCRRYRVEYFDIRHGRRAGISSIGGPTPAGDPLPPPACARPLAPG